MRADGREYLAGQEAKKDLRCFGFVKPASGWALSHIWTKGEAATQKTVKQPPAKYSGVTHLVDLERLY
jgi:hypothetical protein